MSYNPNAGGGAALTGQNMWEKPPSPNALDDEFEDAVLDAAWVYTGFGQALDFTTPPDPYTAPTSHRAATAQHRGGPGGGGSWLKMQLEASVGNGGIQKPLGALPANQFYWARLQFNWRNAVAPTLLDGRCYLSIFETGTMASSIPTNGVNVALMENDRNGASVAAGMWTRDSGAGFSNQSFTADQNDGTNEAYSSMSGYVGIQKIGNVYHGWVAHSEQGWLYMGNVTNTSGFDWDSVAVWGANEIDTNPSAMIIGVDFVRVVDGIFLP